MPEITKYEPYSGKFQLLVYGRFKTGKTWGAATFPRPNIIDFDGGIETVKQKAWQDKYPGRVVRYEQFKERDLTPQGIPRIPNAFDDACRYFDEWMKPGKRDEFDTWVVDSGTTLSEFASYKGIYLLGGKMPGVKSGTHELALKHGLMAPKQQDFGAERSMVEQFVDMMIDAGKHFILVCHEKELFTKDGNSLESRVPLLTGQSVERIPLKFDEVYRLTMRPDGPSYKRSLQTQPDAINKCGSRLGLPDGTEWSFEAITKALGMENK